MLKIFLNLFKSKKRKFHEKIKKEKNRLYPKQRKKQTNYRKKRPGRQAQIHINFNFQKKNIIIFYLIGFIASLIWLLFIFKWEYFSIQEININSQDTISDINITYNSLDFLRNKNIFLISKKDIFQKILSYQKNIDSISINKKLPHTLNINIISSPIAFNTIFNEKNYILTTNWVAIQKKPSSDKQIKTLEIINNSSSNFSNINYSQILEEITIKKITFLLESLQDNLIDYSNKKITYYSIEKEIHLLLNNNTLLIFNLSWNIKKQIKKLIVFNTEKKKLRYIYIDLRIVNKIFSCDYDKEFYCRKNLKRIYTKK